MSFVIVLLLCVPEITYEYNSLFLKKYFPLLKKFLITVGGVNTSVGLMVMFFYQTHSFLLTLLILIKIKNTILNISTVLLTRHLFFLKTQIL